MSSSPVYSATTTQSRDACHSARDAFYASCSPAASSAASSPAPAGSTQPKQSCAELRAAYEAHCLKSWVVYWDERVKRGRPILGKI